MAASFDLSYDKFLKGTKATRQRGNEKAKGIEA
jgi:hypothetical protein